MDKYQQYSMLIECIVSGPWLVATVAHALFACMVMPK